MHKFIAIIALIACLGLQGFSQAKEKNEKEEKHKNISVPKEVETSLAKRYPGANAKWEMEDTKYEASFKYEGHVTSALFDSTGFMEESEVEIKFSELPAAASGYIKTHYKGIPVKEVAKITKANGEINYEAEVRGMDLIFDTTGKFLKEVKN